MADDLTSGQSGCCQSSCSDLLDGWTWRSSNLRFVSFCHVSILNNSPSKVDDDGDSGLFNPSRGFSPQAVPVRIPLGRNPEGTIWGLGPGCLNFWLKTSRNPVKETPLYRLAQRRQLDCVFTPSAHTINVFSNTTNTITTWSVGGL